MPHLVHRVHHLAHVVLGARPRLGAERPGHRGDRRGLFASEIKSFIEVENFEIVFDVFVRLKNYKQGVCHMLLLERQIGIVSNHIISQSNKTKFNKR